jgi:hypothetical protein
MRVIVCAYTGSKSNRVVGEKDVRKVLTPVNLVLPPLLSSV